MERKEHLTRSGFIALLDIVYKMNDEGKQRKRTKTEIIASMRDTSETKRETHRNVMI